jgi:calcium-dependent protein kinase
VQSLLRYDPEKRVTATEALNHRWIAECCQEKLDIERTKLLLNDMRTFNARHKLQQAALTYIVSQLVTSNEKAQMQTVFLELDRDGNGKLSKEELVTGYKRVFGDGYPAEEEVDKIMEKLDIDHSGHIELTEFVMATLDKKLLLSRERLISAFRMFDRVPAGINCVGRQRLHLGS